jgi:uncharacterized protein (DUF952 family)
LEQVRTVSLRDALARVKTWVTSNASGDDLGTLVGMRDGTVHAARDDEVEERLMVAFVQQADALLADLDRNRGEFWGGQLDVVDALLADASDRVKHRVGVKIASAVAAFNHLYGEAPEELLQAVRKFAASQVYERNQEPSECPVCQSTGVATGVHDVDYEAEWEDGEVVNAYPTVLFRAEGFRCRVCGFRLDSAAEWVTTGMEKSWEVEGANPREYEPPFDQDAYDEWRAAQAELEE